MSLGGGGLTALAVISAAAIDRRTDRRTRDAAVLAGSVAAAVGLVDDLFGTPSARGIRGHARAAGRGEMTTGVLKVGAIGAGGLLAGWRLGEGGVARRLAAGTVIAASANVINLLDLRPGRALKSTLVMSAAGAALGGRGRRLAVAAGACAIGSLPADLREHTMLGDGGANCLGAVLGVSLVAGASTRRVASILATFTALTLASEVVSFSSVIEKSPALRWFDRLGRLPEIGSSKSHHA
ncbi:MAG: hypothetical protein ACRDV3_10280 [Acidothermaceae bacterium]